MTPFKIDASSGGTFVEATGATIVGNTTQGMKLPLACMATYAFTLKCLWATTGLMALWLQ